MSRYFVLGQESLPWYFPDRYTIPASGFALFHTGPSRDTKFKDVFWSIPEDFGVVGIGTNPLCQVSLDGCSDLNEFILSDHILIERPGPGEDQWFIRCHRDDESKFQPCKLRSFDCNVVFGLGEEDFSNTDGMPLAGVKYPLDHMMYFNIHTLVFCFIDVVKWRTERNILGF